MKKIALFLLAVAVGGNALSQEVRHSKKHAAIKYHVVPDSLDNRFGQFMVKRSIQVPLNYEAGAFIDTSMSHKCAAKIVGPLRGEWENLRGDYFCNPSYNLEPGKTYEVELIPVMASGDVSIEDCVTFLKKHHAVLVGAPGLLLAYDLQKDYFLRDCWICSLDEKENLWTDDKITKYPELFIDSEENGSKITIDLADYQTPITHDFCLLAFIEKK